MSDPWEDDLIYDLRTPPVMSMVVSRDDLYTIMATRMGKAADELDRLRAENERLVDMLNWAYDTLREINISNYDHDDVCSLNAASVEVILGISAVLAKEAGE